MNRKYSYLRRRAAYLASLIILLTPAQSSASCPYVSPGLQIGFTPQRGISFAAQVTLGIAPQYDIGPGITAGVRWSQRESMTYLDVQLASLVGGAGLGIVRIKGNKTNSPVVTGIRFKAWGGVFLNLTYDVYKASEARPVHPFGLIGVLPIPNPLFSGFYLPDCPGVPT